MNEYEITSELSIKHIESIIINANNYSSVMNDPSAHIPYKRPKISTIEGMHNGENRNRACKESSDAQLPE